MKTIIFILLALSLFACSKVGPGLANHPGDCAIGVPWADCLPGTPGYDNGGGSMHREEAAQTSSHQQRVLAQQCSDEMANPALDPIRNKVELLRSDNDGPPPFLILSNSSIPTMSERSAIAKWATIREECFRRQIQFVSTSNGDPLIRDKSFSFVRQAAEQINVLTVALYQGKMTYGEFARERTQIDESAEAARRDWLITAQAAEQERRANRVQLAIQQEQVANQQYDAWLQASMRQTQQMQSQLQALHSTTTNCMWVGNLWNCTTR